jgi:phenylalanyl-tRNA synthetase beta chain
MNVSRRWLEAFLNRPLDPKDLVARLAMLGAPVDAVEPQGEELARVVVGQVVELAPHPNADRLQVCQVDIGGGERRQVVTGATNVAAGRKYPFAPVGVTLPNGLTLEKRKLRGELSEGMLCSPDEIGLGSEHDGLLTLETDLPPGTPMPRVLGHDDERLVLDISPMRGDLLGHKGIARELAAAYHTPFRLPRIESSRGVAADLPPFVRSTGPARTAGIEVAVAAGSCCRRFTAIVLDGVTIGPSPDWLRERLAAVGQRSINNVVDVTNYAMFELGQPLHAYDAAAIRGGRLVARLATPGERLVTLDGVTRSLDPSMTVVADGAGPSGIGGIIGGGASEVTAGTTRVVLEAAWWNPPEIRSTRKALGLITEASQRFERGADLYGLPDSLRRAAEILLAVAGGTVVDAPVDVWPEPTHPPRIFLRIARVRQIVGVELGWPEIEQALIAIGATVLAKPEDGRLAVDVPGWRRDLLGEIDLVEEVARIYGYDRLPDEVRPFRPGNQTDAPIEGRSREVRLGLAAEGLFEVVLLPIGQATSPAAVPILNPLSADHGFLRERLVAGLTRAVEANWANQVRDVRLFEIGTVFAGRDDPRPAETIRVGGVVTGARSPAHWTDGGATPDLDWWDLKGLFDRAVSLANPSARVQVEGQELVARSPSGGEVGRAMVVAADAPRWAAPVYGFEIDLDPAPRPMDSFEPPPHMPGSARDLALIVPWTIASEAVLAAMRRLGGGLLESIQVIDQYEGGGVPADARSLAFRLVFRSRDRTLRDTEVDGAIQRIRTGMEKQLGITLRTT